ncbi:RAD51-associated protein 2 [Petaurus breviceps papuanus]|uniref:RAD51-associated protein 2 n=1 Tax=Petaurus breviceps papuanus TaxID=3040969 RepID=UPI0036DABEE7
MEPAPGSPSGPPEAKRPRLGEHAPEGGPVSTEPPRPQSVLWLPPLSPLPQRAPLLGGPPLWAPVMPAEPEGKAVVWARPGPALLPAPGSPSVRVCVLGAVLVWTQQRGSPEGSYRVGRPRWLERQNPRSALEMSRFEFLHHLNEIPKGKLGKLKSENNSPFLEEAESAVPKKRSRNARQGNTWLLTASETSRSASHLMRSERSAVRECGNGQEGGCVSDHVITPENVGRDVKKYCDNSFHAIPEDTLFSVFDTFEKVLLLSNLGDTDSLSLSKRDYNNNASAEKASSLEALHPLNVRDFPQFTLSSQINTTEHVHKTNTNSQDTVIEKKQIFNISSFNFKGKFNCFLDIEQQVKNYNIIYIGPNIMAKTQEELVGNFLSEGKEKIQNLIWNDRKHPTESFMGIHSYQISNGSKIEREQKHSITTGSTVVCMLKSNLLMERKQNLEDARERNQAHDNQNNTADRNEHQTILQESASANSKHFHPNNEFTEFVNHKFKTYLATRNNEHFPDLRAECLSTETKTMNHFEMKSKFDIVLKELCLFFEIGKEEETLANSRLFHLKNEATEFNHKLKTDLITRHNRCSLDKTAECLSTETKTVSDFQMKSEFDIVLKELCLFHEIGKEEEASCIGETRNNEEKNDFDTNNSVEEVHQKIEEDLTVASLEKICTPSLPCDTVTSVNLPETAQSSFKWKKIRMDLKKEVPHEYCPSSPSDDELLHPPSGGDFEKAFSQNPALFSDAFMEGRIHSLLKGGSSLSHGIVRVYPLKTCRGPIRIGLSRKAKPKQLHPYLK